MKKLIHSFFSVFIFLVPGFLYSQAPPLREQVSLNGIWDFTVESGEKSSIKVPEYWDAAPGFTKKVQREYIRDGDTLTREVTAPSTSTGIYEREVQVPAGWENKVIKLEFEGINHIADVYVNDQHLKTHIGGWTPFKVDVTELVTAGESFQLKVIVKGGDQSPIVDDQGNPQWPVGWYGHQSRWGIIFDTWLRAYGQVYIDDTFIQTSWRKKQITIDYDVINQSNKQEFIILHGTITEEHKTDPVLVLKSDPLALEPGQRKNVRITEPWQDPLPWNPNTPNLYILTSEVYDGNTDKKPIDDEQRRFGFREIWIEGNELRFNGHRLNLRGTSINTHGQGYSRDRYTFISKASWNRTIDRLQYLNIQSVRFHQQPPSEKIIEIADERGLLVIEESPMYARRYILESNNEIYFRNSLTWLKPWIKDRRNHPSVIMWSSENEIGRNWLRWFSDDQIKTLADSIRSVDPTRPVIAEGDFDVGDDFYSLHYPEGVGKTVTGSIYSWDSLVSVKKPTGIGEFLFGNTDGKEWWHGTWSRGLRYVNVDQIMPYTLKWSWIVDSTTAVYENLRNSFAPIALFDKSYDDLGIDVIRKKNYPDLKAGEKVNRTLILYNDDFSGRFIEVEVRLEQDGKILAQDICTFELALGEHREIECGISTPPIAGLMDLVLVTRKNGHLTFEEHKTFRIDKKEGTDERSEPHVRIFPWKD